MNTYIIIAAMILGWLYQIGSMPEQTDSTNETISLAEKSKQNNSDLIYDDIREQFAYDLATRLGNTSPSPEIIAFIVQWTIAEDSSNGAFNRNNPLNTTQTGFNATHSINDDGVKGYATYEDGINATLQTLSYGYYTEIVAGIQTNDSQRALQGLFNSPWASSHYNYGASWPSYMK